ncbi:MAG TPA: sigma-70 family RNA polymerase sigma factor [Opitutaceae bacterium]|nr:sigma-70 family RNA polymerase sigma factor [Opitutaceae bacterium]
MEASEHDSWTIWFQHYGPKLLLCARQWTDSAADAEDLVQEAFVRFWRRQRHLGGDPLPLLVTSIRRAALDVNRRDTRRERRELAAESPGEAVWFEPVLENDERRQAIEAALRRLPEEQRSVLVLKIWGELTFQQIAAALDTSPNTAASRYRYGLAALRQELTAVDRHG